MRKNLEKHEEQATLGASGRAKALNRPPRVLLPYWWYSIGHPGCPPQGFQAKYAQDGTLETTRGASGRANALNRPSWVPFSYRECRPTYFSLLKALKRPPKVPLSNRKHSRRPPWVLLPYWQHSIDHLGCHFHTWDAVLTLFFMPNGFNKPPWVLLMEEGTLETMEEGTLETTLGAPFHQPKRILGCLGWLLCAFTMPNGFNRPPRVLLLYLKYCLGLPSQV